MNSIAGHNVVNRHQQLLESADVHIYKVTEDGQELKAWVFKPDSKGEEVKAPATGLLFFHDSLWDQGVVSQFAPQCLYFAERGAVGVVVEYRTSQTHGATPMDSISDARSAIRWMRFNAETLGLDVNRLIVGGASAGAHLALTSAMCPGLSDDPNDPPLSCVPDAMVLFCPIVDTSRKGVGFDRFPSADAARKANPSLHITKKLPPSIIFHGTADRIIPFETVARFAKLMKRKRNVCEMIVFQGREHSFYNFNVDADGYEATRLETDRFLVEQGFLETGPEDDFVSLD